MSLYDDLGLRQDATAEEVREHYRVLVRMFHPDQFSDPVMKAAAESQMRRINEIVTILTDPDRYRAYQAERLAPIYIQAPQAAVPARRVPLNSLAWGAAALACACAIVWVSGHEELPAPIAATAAAASHRFSGMWFYAKRPEVPEKLYAPEYIETQITEHGGRVRGHYRSRYRGPDPEIPPVVNFEFTGEAVGTSAQMPLTAEDGTQGEVHLRLISEHELELAWTATGAGSPSPTSGTAILVRDH